MKDKFEDHGIKYKWVGGGLPLHQAVENHPEMRRYVRENKKPHLIRSRDSLLTYNYYIAKDIYDLDIVFEPERAIIPTPGLRYRFLEVSLEGLGFKKLEPYTSVWVSPKDKENEENEDQENRKEEKKKDFKQPEVLEIGTGASAIIALLAAEHFNCKVMATEIDAEYISYAQKNIERNGLSKQITLVKSQGNIIQDLIEEGRKFDLIISNPPYYPELPEKESVWGGAKHELLGKGTYGEKFIIRMIREGLHHLKKGGLIAVIIPKKLQKTLIATENFLKNNNVVYDILGLKAGNRIRYVFRVFSLV